MPKTVTLFIKVQQSKIISLSIVAALINSEDVVFGETSRPGLDGWRELSDALSVSSSEEYIMGGVLADPL